MRNKEGGKKYDKKKSGKNGKRCKPLKNMHIF